MLIAVVRGGGLTSQASADARVVERNAGGRLAGGEKGARRSFQFSKR